MYRHISLVIITLYCNTVTFYNFNILEKILICLQGHQQRHKIVNKLSLMYMQIITSKLIYMYN